MVPELDGRRVQQSLTEMLQSICNSAHEQCARLLSPRTNDMSLLERVSSQEFVDLAQLIQNFVVDCEKISGHQARDLRIAFQVRTCHCGPTHRFSHLFLFVANEGPGDAIRTKVPRRATLQVE